MQIYVENNTFRRKYHYELVQVLKNLPSRQMIQTKAEYHNLQRLKALVTNHALTEFSSNSRKMYKIVMPTFAGWDGDECSACGLDLHERPIICTTPVSNMMK